MNNEDIVNNTCNGLCSCCGSCCSLFIPFTEKELTIIKQYVKEHNIKPINREDETSIKASCCFYDDKNHKCNIYEVRPYACRDFKCDHKDWKKRRELYCKRAKYNSIINNKVKIATFDDLIYGDFTYIIRYLCNMSIDKRTNAIDSDILIEILKKCNRLDILDHFSVYDENNNKIEGKDLMKGN